MVRDDIQPATNCRKQPPSGVIKIFMKLGQSASERGMQIPNGRHACSKLLIVHGSKFYIRPQMCIFACICHGHIFLITAKIQGLEINWILTN